MKRTAWGFDERDTDASVRPQDDFYQYAGGTWLKKNPIPKAESRWGSFMMLRYDTDKKLHAILDELEAMKRVAPGSPEQLVRDFYRSGMDMKRRNALGAKPLAEWQARVKQLSTKEEMLDLIAALERIGAASLWGAAVAQDSKNTDQYLLHFYQGGLGMPDCDYYLKNDAESKRVRDAYLPYMEKMWKLLGHKPAEAKRRVALVMDIETRIAKAWMNKVDRRDADKTYHKMTVKEFGKLSPNIDWSRYLSRIGAKNAFSAVVMMPDFFRALSSLLEDVSLEDWKVYLEWHLANDFADALSDRFVKASFSFYGTVLSGTKVMKPLWRRTLNAVSGNLGELLGRVYVKRHFSPLAKKKMNLLVDDLFAAYEIRLKNLDWMTPATKRKALQKLRAMNRKIGYPDAWKSFKGLVIRADDYAGNIIRSNEYEHSRQLKKLNGPIDRGEWFMYPQTVNAYFDPNLNDIAFPAAILQPPFFDPSADAAINYGSIGTVIGHEITHGFDDQGSKYDAKGNLKSWWTAEDRARFEKKAQMVVDQFDRYEVADGLKVNGKLTLGENIADLGGLAIALDAYQRELARTGRRDIEGRTPEQRFFLGFSLFERELSRPESQKMQVLTDPHSPGKFRINGPVSNVEAFYEAFGLKKGDKLYREPKDRAKIW